MFSISRASKVKVCKEYLILVLLIGLPRQFSTASVKTARPYDPNVYIVTPEPYVKSEARDFPVFLPTPLTEDFSKDSVQLAHKKQRTTTTEPPDIIIAEFRKGSKNGTADERMVSVREMLSKEKVQGPYYVPPSPTTTTPRPTRKAHVMDVKDVWDIIKHNQDLETTSTVKPEPTSTATPLPRRKKISRPPIKVEKYSVETVPSISSSNDAWLNSEPKNQSIETSKLTEVTVEEPRTIRGGSSTLSLTPNQLPARIRYYPAYRRPDTQYNTDTSSNLRPGTGEAQDRYNPAQPYLPPRQPMEPEASKESIAAPLMPPPPPPQQYMTAPSATYDAIPSYPPPSDSKPPSGPPSEYSYQPPDDDDSQPPSFSSLDHHHHHDDEFKYESPPEISDSYPQVVFDDHHHDDHEEFYHHYHHHHHPPPPPPPTTTTTTPAPEKEDSRVTNRFSYYYLGKKLWYLPLYFSVYFIIYVGSLIIKSIARHKITYPQHYKAKRSLSFKISDEELHNLTRLTCNALFTAADKYLVKS